MNESLFSTEDVKAYCEQGYWRREITSDYCDLNAGRYGDHEAMVDSNRRLTWREARRSVDRLALGLLDGGIAPGEVVVVQLPNCVELFLLRLACEKAGIIVAPVALTWGHREMEAICRHARVRGVVIPRKLRNTDYYRMIQEVRQQAPTVSHLYVVGDDVPRGAISISEMLERPYEKTTPAGTLEKTKCSPFACSAIRPTGGTTGLPKFVAEASCSRLLTARVYLKRTGLTRDDSIGVFGRFTGGAGDPLGYRGAPQAGARVVFLEHFTPESGCMLIERERLTAVGLVPAMLAQLVSYDDLERHDLRSLRFILSSTALLPYALGREAERRLGAPIINGYGSTESASLTVGSLRETQEVRLGTVGKPLDGSDLVLLDDRGRQVPAGEAGEIAVRGPHRTGAFYNDPELTRECWRDGWFHVGDLGTFDGEGNLTLIGRKSDMIIRGGQNIFPREIEDILIQHDKILQAAIVKMPDPVMGEKACAYVVCCRGGEITFSEMVSFLEARKVTKYKWPERLEIVAEFPMASGEKVNKKMLEADIALKIEQDR